MIFFYISLSTYLCYLILKTNKSLLELNKSKFNLKEYYKKITAKKYLFTPELFAIVLIIIAFNTNAKITGICMIVLYTILYLLLLKNKDKKIKIDKQIISTIIIFIIIYLGMFVLFFIDYLKLTHEFFLFDNTKYYYAITIIIGYLSNYVILISAFITKIFTKIFSH